MPSSPEIPLDLREQMHDCILSIFWPRNKIVEFFQSVNCPDTAIPIADEHSRHSLVTEVFSRLSAREDRGYQTFQIMIDRLVNWTYFDPYYFEKLAKLDRSEAEANILALKRNVASRNAKVADVRAKGVRAQAKADNEKSLESLSKAFAKIYGSELAPQARGYLFEQFLKLLFDRHGIAMGDPFRLVGEQIDGSFKFEGENYIVEAKWQESGAATSQLYSFAYKVDGKMHGRGVFISVNGFSHEAIEAIVKGKQIQTILIDGQDLSFVLGGQIKLEEMLDFKIRSAQTRGDVYVCALRKERKL